LSLLDEGVLLLSRQKDIREVSLQGRLRAGIRLLQNVLISDAEQTRIFAGIR
jgi:hypothetical protein